ncbi:MAG: ribonuclease HII [Chloroflexi bacterium]|nr:ribonuclease HII [Chloroflexota bacterium]
MAPTRREERALQRRGFLRVAGLDEVGRGPLAGPLVAAAVILPSDLRASWLSKVRDSKELSEKGRERLFGPIVQAAVATGIGVVQPQEIDALGISAANRLAMLRAKDSLAVAPDYLLIDAVHLEEAGIPFKAIIHGDALCLSIAAASIVAKVTRDRTMRVLDSLYPGYGFAQHKGYPTPSHMEALRKLGPSPIHRRSFRPVAELLGETRG